MPAYNKNSIFLPSGSGTIPNRVDDLIFFQDIDNDQKAVWDEFERIMATGDYDAANAYAKSYIDVHGYFADLYNLMVNRIKAVQDLLISNKTAIDNGTGNFAQFKKPEIFVYQNEDNNPKTILKDQVWIGPKGYFDEVVVEESINKLKMKLADTNNQAHSHGGFDFVLDDDGYITINGTRPNGTLDMRIGLISDPSIITGGDVWSYWNYYVSGNVENYNGGNFYFVWTNPTTDIRINTTRKSNMHANLIGIRPGDTMDLFFQSREGEVYDNLKVGFMICKTSDTTPNQKFVKYEGA